jgi:TonB-dependent starch-binding outer membrane protein SusC
MKKNLPNLIPLRKSGINKLLLTMKLALIIVFLSVLQVSANVYSQITVNLDVQQKSIRDVLKTIEQQSEVRFFYSDDLLVMNELIDLKADNKNIISVLDDIFSKSPLTYKAYDNNLIVIVPRELLQQQKITGTATDEKGNPVAGVTVLVKGTTIGALTDATGKYTIDNAPLNATLIFSFVGMTTQEIPSNGQILIDVVLKEVAIGLDEVVVVGYGTQRKVTLTGSVSAIKSKELTHSPVVSVSNSLSGLLPGVIALNRSGEPGRDISSILIRGMSTTGNTNPLVVVDGIQGYTGWERINSNDIESISILKDASAAIYGARAANGVILITTKRGTAGKPTIDYSFSEGISQPTRVPKMASSALFAEFINDRNVMYGGEPKYTDAEIQKFKDGSDPLNYPNTDWYSEVLKKTSLQSQHNLRISGGTEKIQYLVSGSYSNQDGIFKDGSTNFKTYSLRANFDGQINKNIKVGFDMNASMQDGNYPGVSTESTFNYLGLNLPTMPVYWPNGSPSVGLADGNNPAVMVTDASGNNNERIQQYVAKASFDIIIPWVSGLGIDGYFAFTTNNTAGKYWQKPWKTYAYDIPTDTYTLVMGGGMLLPQLTESASNFRSNLVNLRVKYEKQFNDHHLSTFIAVEQFEGKGNDFSAFRKDYISSELDELFAGSLTGMEANGSSAESGRKNFFGRISYGFREKYLLDFNFRYDGSSNFPEGNQWGFFPGASVAWRISQENFMKNNLSFVNNLKLRASYGQIGNDQVPPFQWLSTYSIGQNGYTFGLSPVTTLGLVAGVTPNPNITWEVAEISNIGLDGTLWKGLLGFSVDFFKQRRSNILATRDLAVPYNTGLKLPDENIGIVENKGIELQLSHSQVLSEISYTIAGNVAYSKNNVIDISEPQNIPEWQKAEGHVLDADNFYKCLGIIRTEEELASLPVVAGSMVGDLYYEDTDGDKEITSNDMVRLDKTNIPQITFGFNVSASYKNFSLWANFSGQTRAWQYFHKYSKEGGYNSLEDLLANRYTTGSMNSKYPIIPSSETETMDVSGFHSTFWLEDASFIRLKTLELAYTLPVNLLSKAKIQSMRVFVNGNNLFIIDKLKWYDPEGNNTEGNFYPQSKIYNIGINISF